MFRCFLVFICFVCFGLGKTTAQSVNIAQNKATTQSSTATEGGAAHLAVDNNTNGDFYNGSVSQTKNEANAWWQVDLGQNTTIGLIQIHNRTDSFSERLSNFYVFISDTDLTGHSFSEIVSDCEVNQFHVAQLTDSTLHIPKEVSGRYVRIQLVTTNALSLAEVKVFTSALSNTNCTDFCVVEDFDTLLNGSVRGQNDWITNEPGALDGAIVSSEVIDGFTGKALMNDPNGVIFRGNTYKSLQQQSILENNTGTLFFQLMAEDVSNSYSHFGLTDLANPRLTDGGSGNIKLYNDYEVQLTIDHGKFRVRNGIENDHFINITPENGVVYNIWIVVDNTNDQFEVYIQGGANEFPVKGKSVNDVSKFSFRNGTLEPLQTLYLINSPAVKKGVLYYDSFYVDDQKENLTLPIVLEQALSFKPIETFENLNLGALHSQNDWNADINNVFVAVDSEHDSNQVLKINSGSMNAYKSIPEIRNCDVGTLYFRLKRSGFVNESIGLSDVNEPSEYADYENQINMQNSSNDLNARSGSSFLTIDTIVNEIWYCVWMVTNNPEDTYKIYLQGNGSDTPKMLSSGSLSDFSYRNNSATNPLTSFFVKQNNSAGIFYIDDIYIHQNEVNLHHPSSGMCTHGGEISDTSLPLNDPISASIPVSNAGIVLEEFVTIPASSSSKPVTRINFLHHSNDNTNRLFTNDLNNKLYVIENNVPLVYLDVSAQFTNFAETPRLGSGFGFFTFHPEFETNGKFYTVHTERFDALTNKTPDYTSAAADDMHGVITEWTATDPLATSFSGTKKEILRIGFDTALHGFQQIGFNPNAVPGNEDYGLLYLALGDGEENPIFSNASQDLAVPHGKILRIDPAGNNASNGKYGIPASNPFVNEANALGEIWAYGFRNPHRFSWDTGGTNKMFIGNIGEKNIDAIYLGKAGANYGWNKREGSFLFKTEDPNNVYALPDNDEQNNFSYPVAEYDHDEGFAVVGGFVYRGNAIPELQGKYIFGDVVKGRIFFTEESEMIDGKSFAEIQEFMIYDENGNETTMLNLAGNSRADLRFGIDANNEMYALSKQNGKIWKITGAKGLKVTDFAKNKTLNAFPNPVETVLNIELKGLNPLNSDELEFNLYSVLGQKLKTIRTAGNASKVAILMNELPKGIYVLTTTIQNTIYTKRILKN